MLLGDLTKFEMCGNWRKWALRRLSVILRNREQNLIMPPNAALTLFIRYFARSERNKYVVALNSKYRSSQDN